MALGKTKDDILGITGEITFDDIKAAIDYLDKNKVTPRGETSYFLKDEERIGYSFNQIIKTINNDIKKNKTLLKTGEVDTFEIVKIFQNIKFPENYKLIFPWNENGKIQIKKIRDSIIDYAQNLGFELNDNPSAYTAIRYMNRNFAEIHYPDRDSKIRVDVFYDRLPQSFRNKFGKKLERYPDSHNYALNGKFVVTLATKTVEQIKEIIQYSYEHGKEILDKEGQNPIVINNIETQNTSSNNIIPLNQILYGPPGTGKTYYTKEVVENILAKNTVEKTEKTIKNVDANTPWWQAIALAMYKKDKNQKYKVIEIENLIKDYIRLKNNNSVRNKIWEQLQKHTDYISETVFAKDRNEPFIFDKTSDSAWYLTDKGVNYIEDQLMNTIITEQGDSEKNKYFDFVTFHQSYSYEEFIEGIKPSTKNGQIEYNIINGIFKNMCIKANSDPNNNYILVIDEINRGNISKIFGELITLIEEDKRIIPNGSNDIDDADLEINEKSKGKNSIVTCLPYSQKQFGVPSNLYILGTMNTSDRSIASIDIALRRRFKFKEMMPNSNLVADFGIGFNKIFDDLNNKIKLLLDRDHQIGHSYFINTKYNGSNGNNNIEILKDIWFSEILPLLNEYFYCDWEKLKLIIPGFIKKLDVPEVLKNECDDSIYEFKTFDEVADFEKALNQEKFEQV